MLHYRLEYAIPLMLETGLILLDRAYLPDLSDPELEAWMLFSQLSRDSTLVADGMNHPKGALFISSMLLSGGPAMSQPLYLSSNLVDWWPPCKMDEAKQAWSTLSNLDNIAESLILAKLETSLEEGRE